MLYCPHFLSSGDRPFWATAAGFAFLPQLLVADAFSIRLGRDGSSLVIMTFLMALAYVPSLVEAWLVLVVWDSLRLLWKDRADEQTH